MALSRVKFAGIDSDIFTSGVADSAQVQSQFDSAFPSAFDTRFALQDTHDSAAVAGQISATFPSVTDSGGNVGIGVVPTNKLDVGGGITVQQAANIKWQNTARNTTYGGIKSTAAALSITWNDSDKVVVNSSGNLSMSGGNITSSQNGFNPTTSGWATGAAFIGTSSYGGGLSFVDGSAGYTLYVDTAGTNFRISQGSTSGGVTNRLTIDPNGRLLVGGTSTTSSFKTPIWVEGYKAIGFGQAGSGVGGSVGAKRLDSIGNLDYSSYFAYDCHWDHENSYWVSHRDTLSAKLIMQAGYHSGGFQFLKYAGSASATFSDSSLTELARIDADGIKFNGDTAAANGLDDYEEGTWTATFAGSTTAGTFGFSSREAHYTKIGNIVTCYLAMSGMTLTGAAGALYLNGLPYTSKNVAGGTPSGGVAPLFRGFSWTGDYVSHHCRENTNRVEFWATDNGTIYQQLAVGNFGTEIYISFSYLT